MTSVKSPMVLGRQRSSSSKPSLQPQQAWRQEEERKWRWRLSRSQTALLGAPRLPCVAGSGLKRIDFGVPVGIKIHAKICPPVFMKLPV
jgi:hypothetical protein